MLNWLVDDENLNHKRKTEKEFRKNKRNQTTRAFTTENRVSYFIEGLTEEENSKADEDLNNLKYDKVALYLAAKDIFKEVADEYTSKSIIVSRFYELIEKYISFGLRP